MDEHDLALRRRLSAAFAAGEPLPEAGYGSLAAEHVVVLDDDARRWYGDRLDPAWRPRPRDESQAILDGLGLTGPFWRLP